MLRHVLVQDKKAQGSYKSEYHCEDCLEKWAYYDQGDFQRSQNYINNQWPCKGKNAKK